MLTPARPEEECIVSTCGEWNSENPHFHGIIRNIVNAIESAAINANIRIDMGDVNSFLLVIRSDHQGDLWIGTAAMIVNTINRSGRTIHSGECVSRNDIFDMLGVSFPAVRINKEDKIVFLQREGWRFSLFYDFNPSGNLDTANMERTIGRQLRTLKHFELYETLGSEQQLNKVFMAGWFPFAEIIDGEFADIYSTLNNGWEIDGVIDELIAKFSRERLDRLLFRWSHRPSFPNKEGILREAIDGFLAGRPIATIKILSTEIEGILRDEHIHKFNKPEKLKNLMNFAVGQAALKCGAGDTLHFPDLFQDYLKQCFAKHFDPMGGDAAADSRHAVAHGAAEQDSYTMEQALKYILIVDQLYYYI